MKLKNLIYLLPFSVMGCVGLEQYPTNSYTDANYWNNEENVRAALYLGYNQCWSWDYYFANNILSDDVFGSRHSENERNVVTGLANTSTGRFESEWDACYQELRTIHTTLDAQDRITSVDEAFKTRMLAELRLMRAWTYFRLITWYGDVPFFTTNPTLPEAREIGVTDENTIRQFILDELDYAASVLPKNTDLPASENGRYTCGTAIAIKARVYLYNNDFENCAKECEKLINSTEYGTYDLANDFDELFKTGHYGPESIMTIETAYNSLDDVLRYWTPGDWCPQSVGNRGVTKQSPTQELVNVFLHLDGTVADDTDYENRDRRFYSTIAYNGCKVDVPVARTDLGLTTDADGRYTCYTDPDDEDVYGNGTQNDAYDGSQDRTATGYYGLKNYYAADIDAGGHCIKPIMEIRFAEILLNYAESKNEMGEMNSEIWNKTIKRLRERAGFGEAYCSYPSGDNLRQTIRDERRAELALEGRRVFDLRRWAVMEDATIRETGASFLTTQATGAPFMDNGSNIVCQNPYNMKYWFAIPQAERDINHNLPQNPGW